MKAIHRIKTLEKPHEYALWFAETPGGVLGISTLAGFGVGKVVTFAAGRLAFKPIAGLVLKGGMIAGGTALVAPQLADIKSTFEKGEVGEGLGKVGKLSVGMAGGYVGYKTGASSFLRVGPSKGLTPYEAGYKTAYPKYLYKQMAMGKMPIPQGLKGIKLGKLLYEKILPDIRSRTPIQYEPNLGNVQSIAKHGVMKTWFSKHLRWKWRKSELFGGASEEVAKTHDIDVTF